MPKIVEIHNVSKKYVICHGAGVYNTLVDTLSHKARYVLNKLKKSSTPSRYTFEEFWALQNVSLDIEEGDRIAIIGKNGAGKSTLLKILSRITYPTTGQLKIRGRVASLLEVGTGFHLELTGRENIFLNGAILGMKRQEIKKKFDEIVAFADVEKFLDTPVKRFSSGMYMRLGFAIAAHLDPDMLIVDEVLAVGDSLFQEKCLRKLNDLSRHGRTILFVSHDMGSVLSLCTKGVLMDKGIVKTTGPIEQCVEAYMRTYRLQGLSWQGHLGQDSLRFYSAALTADNDPFKEFFIHQEQAKLELEYEVLKPMPDLVISVSVWNQRNQMLAKALTLDTEDHMHKFIAPGRHKASFTIDTGLFHEGEYIVKVDCLIPNHGWIIHDEILLKLPIFSQKKNRLTRDPEREGVSLGKRWQLHK